MEKIIAFHIAEEDKALIEAVAKKRRLSTSSFCRNYILEGIDQFKLMETTQ